jgi:ribonuclease Z
MKIELFVVSGRTLDTSPSFLIVIDSFSYLFNVPDGTERLFLEHKWKLSHIKQMFFTGHYPDSMGGIFGTLLTLAVAKMPRFGITADSRVQRSIIASTAYSPLPVNLPVFTPEYADDVLTVTAIPLTQTIAYRLQFCDYPGKFLPENAKRLNIPAGSLFRKLTSGESITLEDGRIINPSDVMTPSTPGDVVLVIDCRSVEDFPLLKNIDLANVSFFVHITEPSILNNPEYLSLFPSDGRKHLSFLSSGRISYKAIAELYSKVTGSSVCSGPD